MAQAILDNLDEDSLRRLSQESKKIAINGPTLDELKIIVNTALA